MKRLFIGMLYIMLYSMCSTISAKNYLGANTIEGVKYYFYSDFTAEVERVSDKNIEHIEVPDYVEYYSYDSSSYGSYKVVSIHDSAFSGCKNLKTVILPETVADIKYSAFSGCSSLRELTLSEGLIEIGPSAFNGCSSLQELIIPNSVQVIGGSAFSDCSSLSKLVLPETLTEIGSYTFLACSSLQELILPESVKEIGRGAFSKCSSLQKINLPEGLTSITPFLFNECASLTNLTLPMSVSIIDERAFDGCSSLQELILPSGLKKIGKQAFSGCTSLKELIIPAQVITFDDYAFENDCLNPLLLQCAPARKYGNALRGLKSDSRVLVKYDKLEDWKSCGFGGEIYTYDNPYNLGSFNQYICGISFILDENTNYIGEEIVKTDVLVGAYEYNSEKVMANSDGVYTIYGLQPATKYGIYVKSYDSQDNEVNMTVFNRYTKTPSEDILQMGRSSTQTTIEVSYVDGKGDESAEVVYGAVRLGDDGKYDSAPVKFSNLIPGQYYYLTGLLTYKSNGKMFDYTFKKGIKTQPLNPTLKAISNGPTTVAVEAMYKDGDADITKVVISAENQKVEGTYAMFKGLKPNTEYKLNAKFYSYAKELADVDLVVNTPDLILTTLSPKCVSATCAIVAAETNACDEETGIGFQWRKYDAPASLASNEGYAAVYDGKAEGYIRNLQSTSYYNARVFYKDAEDRYIFGDWITFDPSDFSYFEPTVHTYEAHVTNSRTATLKGYTLPGTDDIIEQGFEYWPLNNQQKAKAVKAPEAVTTILASGQVMTVTVDDLSPETTYVYRAFVRTKTETTYGEEQSFTTPVSSGIYDVVTDEDAEVEIIGYYDMHGNKYLRPLRGMNIILYSNGTARKVYIAH